MTKLTNQPPERPLAIGAGLSRVLGLAGRRRDGIGKKIVRRTKPEPSRLPR